VGKQCNEAAETDANGLSNAEQRAAMLRRAKAEGKQLGRPRIALSHRITESIGCCKSKPNFSQRK
jgi:hypothetical protein